MRQAMPVRLVWLFGIAWGHVACAVPPAVVALACAMVNRVRVRVLCCLFTAWKGRFYMWGPLDPINPVEGNGAEEEEEGQGGSHAHVPAVVPAFFKIPMLCAAFGDSHAVAVSGTCALRPPVCRLLQPRTCCVCLLTLTPGLLLAVGGRVWTWGSNMSGALGIGSGDHSRVQDQPIVVPAFESVLVCQVAAGAAHSVALSGTGVFSSCDSGAALPQAAGHRFDAGVLCVCVCVWVCVCVCVCVCTRRQGMDPCMCGVMDGSDNLAWAILHHKMPLNKLFCLRGEELWHMWQLEVSTPWWQQMRARCMHGVDVATANLALATTRVPSHPCTCTSSVRNSLAWCGLGETTRWHYQVLCLAFGRGVWRLSRQGVCALCLGGAVREPESRRRQRQTVCLGSWPARATWHWVAKLNGISGRGSLSGRVCLRGCVG